MRRRIGVVEDAVRWVGALREGEPAVGSSAGRMLLRAARQPGNPSTHIKLTTCLHRFVGVAILQPAWSSSTACKLAAWHSFASFRPQAKLRWSRPVAAGGLERACMPCTQSFMGQIGSEVRGPTRGAREEMASVCVCNLSG